MTRRTNYDLDESISGVLAWCKCGWRTNLETDRDFVTEQLLLHRQNVHAEGRARVSRRLAVAS